MVWEDVFRLGEVVEGRGGLLRWTAFGNGVSPLLAYFEISIPIRYSVSIYVVHMT